MEPELVKTLLELGKAQSPPFSVGVYCHDVPAGVFRLVRAGNFNMVTTNGFVFLDDPAELENKHKTIMIDCEEIQTLTFNGFGIQLQVKPSEKWLSSSRARSSSSPA